MAADANTKRLMDNARIHLPGALDTALKLELFSVMNDFLTTAECWFEDINFDVVPTTDVFLLKPDSYTYLVNPAEGGSIMRLQRVLDANASVVGATMPVIPNIVLVLSPNTAQTYRARVSKTVGGSLTTDGYPIFPPWILDKYGVEILDGLLGRMMSQPAKPYSSPRIAELRIRSFNAAQAQARTDARHENIYAGQRWSFPQSFASRKI